jgi:hypothetical protein
MPLKHWASGIVWACGLTYPSPVLPVCSTLQAAHAWYSEDATPRFTSAQSSEDLGALKELLEEASTIINEVLGGGAHNRRGQPVGVIRGSCKQSRTGIGSAFDDSHTCYTTQWSLAHR